MVVRILLYIWQLPQNIIGLILVCILTKKIKFTEFSLVVNPQPLKHSVNFGNYTFLPTIDYFNHEKGHGKQSKILGWFYLPLISLPHLVLFLIDKWADYLGELR